MSASQVLVDTSAWFALVVPADPDHQRVKHALAAVHGRLVTTDFNLDETLTLLRARNQSYRATAVWALLHDVQLVTLLHLTESDLEAAWRIFLQFGDKAWSFTDCTSKHVIDTHQILQACSLDIHFQQFGTVAVLP